MTLREFIIALVAILSLTCCGAFRMHLDHEVKMEQIKCEKSLEHTL